MAENYRKRVINPAKIHLGIKRTTSIGIIIFPCKPNRFGIGFSPPLEGFFGKITQNFVRLPPFYVTPKGTDLILETKMEGKKEFIPTFVRF